MTQSSNEPKLIEYFADKKGDIIIPDGAPFDGSSILIKLSSGWCEARWDNGEKIETLEGTEYEGFEWVCMDGDFTAELDDAKFWCELPRGIIQ